MCVSYHLDADTILKTIDQLMRNRLSENSLILLVGHKVCFISSLSTNLKRNSIRLYLSRIIGLLMAHKQTSHMTYNVSDQTLIRKLHMEQIFHITDLIGFEDENVKICFVLKHHILLKSEPNWMFSLLLVNCVVIAKSSTTFNGQHPFLPSIFKAF
jgi:hypothetical protein